MRQECGGCIDELLAAELLAAELTHVEEHIPQSDTTHTHTAQRCLRVRHHLPRFPDVQVNVQKQSVPPETADSENNWSKILPSYFKYLQSYGHQNAYLASFLVSHKQHGFQSETHSLITDRALGAS